jgi:CyaY protein
MTSLLSDREYDQLTEQIFLSLQKNLDQHLDKLDWEIHGEILYLNFEDGEKVVINKQAPLHQLWFASKEGGKHFGWSGQAWIDVRSGESWQATIEHLAQRKGISF